MYFRVTCQAEPWGPSVTILETGSLDKEWKRQKGSTGPRSTDTSMSMEKGGGGKQMWTGHRKVKSQSSGATQSWRGQGGAVPQFQALPFQALPFGQLFDLGLVHGSLRTQPSVPLHGILEKASVPAQLMLNNLWDALYGHHSPTLQIVTVSRLPPPTPISPIGRDRVWALSFLVPRLAHLSSP